MELRRREPGADGSPVAVVTGGARRVGRAICLEMARAGCDVVTTYLTSRGDAESLAAEVRAAGRACEVARVDLRETAACEAWARSVAEQVGRVDALVHNASVYARTPLEELTGAEALAHFRVHALTPVMITRALGGALRASGRVGGAGVVAMLDIHAMGRARRGRLAYAMSKGALLEAVRALALEMAPAVRVNGVAPGVVAWPEEGEESDEAMQERYLRRVPLGRAGTAQEAARVVRWLALEASYVTGEVVRVDGGEWLV